MTKRLRKNSRTPSAPDPVRPQTSEQSGSTGRDPGPPAGKPGVDGKPGTGANTGQGSYGQSGYGLGGFGKGRDAAPNYQKDVPGRDDPRSKTSNRGSGRRDAAEDEGRNSKDERDVRDDKSG